MQAQKPVPAGIREPTQGGTEVLLRIVSNRAEKLSQGAAQAGRNNHATNVDSGTRWKVLQVIQGTRGPPTQGAEMRQSTDQVEPVRSVRSRAVKGRVHPERRARLHSGGSRHLRPSGSLALEETPRSDPSPANGRTCSPVPFE